MQKFEQIIQQAFAKIDASNPKMRQKVYENIWLAQEKTLAEHNLGAPQKQQQRENLTEFLRNVEMRCRTAQPAKLEPAPARGAAARQTHMAKESEAEQSYAEALLPAEESFPRSEPAAAPYDGRNFTAEEPNFTARAPRQRGESRREPQFAYPEAEEIGSSRAERGDYQALPAESAAFAPGKARRNTPHEPIFLPDEPAFAAEQSAPQRAGAAEPKRAAARGRQTAADAEKLDYLEREVNRETAQKAKSPALSSRRRLSPGFCLISALSALVAVFVAWSFYNSFGGAAAGKQRAFSGPMQQNNYAGSGWTEIFSPANAAGLTTTGAVSAELHNEPDANFIRIAARKGDDAAVLEIGEGALLPLRGKTATFKLVARSAENTIGQMSLTAEFGKDTPPRRYSWELAPTAAPLLFRLDIPQRLSGPAKFYIGTEIADGKPHEMDIFSLLLRESDNNGR